MSQIVLNAEQMKIVETSIEPVVIRDNSGNELTTIYPPAFIAELKRRAREPGPRVSSEQVRGHLQKLEEIWQNEGPFDATQMKSILAELRAAERS